MSFKIMLSVLALTASGVAFAQDAPSPKKECCCCCDKCGDGKACCDEKKGDHGDHGKMKH